MRKSLKRLKALVKNPATHLVSGLVLVVSGMAKAIYDLLSAEQSFRLGVHHGVALFGLVQVLGSQPERINGLD